VITHLTWSRRFVAAPFQLPLAVMYVCGDEMRPCMCANPIVGDFDSENPGRDAVGAPDKRAHLCMDPTVYRFQVWPLGVESTKSAFNRGGLFKFKWQTRFTME
jgi:hypothetical protein